MSDLSFFSLFFFFSFFLSLFLSLFFFFFLSLFFSLSLISFSGFYVYLRVPLTPSFTPSSLCLPFQCRYRVFILLFITRQQ